MKHRVLPVYGEDQRAKTEAGGRTTHLGTPHRDFWLQDVSTIMYKSNGNSLRSLCVLNEPTSRSLPLDNSHTSASLLALVNMGVPKTVLAGLLLLQGLPGGIAAPAPNPVVEAMPPPATFTANPNIGPGGGTFRDSPHFRVYGNNGDPAQRALDMLEASYDCFITTLGFRSTGLSYNTGSSDGPWTKVNIYSVATLPGAAGVMHSDAATGMAWLEVQNSYINAPGVVVHEFGHGIHYHQRTWVNQGRTGAWWETFANWIADTYRTSELCAASRSKYNQPTDRSEINVRKTIGDSWQVLVDGTAGSGNYYEAWPFFTFLTSNLDSYQGLGRNALNQLMVQYSANSNETPLHTLNRVVSGGGRTASQVVGRYWARMAYVDIGHRGAQDIFLSQRGSINYNNVQSSGSGRYTVIAARRPAYMGANIIPLTASGGSVSVTITANGAYTATLVTFNQSTRQTRYVDVKGSGSVNVASGEEVSLVVAKTPDQLLLFDPFSLSSEARAGLDYSFTLTGATVRSTAARESDIDIQ